MSIGTDGGAGNGSGLAEVAAGEGTPAPAANCIQKVSHSHDGIIDVLLARPEITLKELGKITTYSIGWLSRVIASDAFQERLAERRDKSINPLVAMKFEERLKAVGMLAADAVIEKLSVAKPSTAVALKALELTARAKVFGARDRSQPRQPAHPPLAVQVNVQNNTNHQVAAGIANSPTEANPPAEVGHSAGSALPAVAAEPAATPFAVNLPIEGELVR